MDDRVPPVALVVALLVLNGVLCLVLAVLYLPLYIGSLAFPISAVLAGAANIGLIALGRWTTDRLALLSLPLAAWLLGFCVCMSSGPGGDVMLLIEWRTLLLFVGGVVPPAVLLYKLAQSPEIR